MCFISYSINSIDENSQITCFRFFWILAVVASASLFVYVMTNRLMLLYDYTSQVNVEITNVDKLAFPAVTVCNHNQFRLVQLQCIEINS